MFIDGAIDGTVDHYSSSLALHAAVWSLTVLPIPSLGFVVFAGGLYVPFYCYDVSLFIVSRIYIAQPVRVPRLL